MIGTRNGVSLVELLVALLLLELSSAVALTTALATHRLNYRIASGAATDVSRWVTVRAAEAEVSCRDSPTPLAEPLSLAPTPERPALAVTLRCGR